MLNPASFLEGDVLSGVCSLPIDEIHDDQIWFCKKIDPREVGSKPYRLSDYHARFRDSHPTSCGPHGSY